MNGAGNDFIIIDHRKAWLARTDQAEFARQICRRKFSAGADGLILLEDDEQVDFCWQFYNADGSLAEMCGNGARCAARYAYEHKIAPAKMRFKTIAGIIEAEMRERTVRLKMTNPLDLRLDERLEIDGVERLLHHINTGVPHVVCFVDDISTDQVREWGRDIRFHPHYQPAGTNVNFVRQAADGLHIRTYERGVEDETMACGTGAVAAALIKGLKGAASPAAIITSGGDKLIIHFQIDSNQQIDKVYLEGGAAIVYEGLLNAEAMLTGR
jgi:diaminopimelate epimerase